MTARPATVQCKNAEHPAPAAACAASAAAQDNAPVQRRNTRQRQLVLDCVRAHSDHPTAEDVYLEVTARDPKISRGTVYRNLNLLEETGVITTVKTPGAMRFDWRCDGHSHVVCRVCGAVADTPLPYDTSADERAAQETGFAVESHSLVFEGICPACQAKLKPEQPQESEPSE